MGWEASSNQGGRATSLHLSPHEMKDLSMDNLRKCRKETGVTLCNLFWPKD